MKMLQPLILVNVLSVLSISAENLPDTMPASVSSPSSPSASPQVISMISSPECSCEKNVSSDLLKNAKDMMHQMRNKSSILKKIKHRATHSNEAIWASISLTLLLVLIIVGLLQSKMWTDQTFLSYPESQPVKFEQYNWKSEIKVKHLLRSQGKTLVGYFSKKKRSDNQNNLKMESFLRTPADQVDASHSQYLLLSESSDEESSSEEDQDVEYSINPVSGMWEGRREPKKVLYKSSRDSRGRYGLLSTNYEPEDEESSEPSEFPAQMNEKEPLIQVK